MNRMILRTAVALCCISLFFNVVFAEHPNVSWETPQLAQREVRLTVKNDGRFDWQRFCITVKVFEDDKVVSVGMLTRTQKLAVSDSSHLRLALDKPLAAGKTYRVCTWLQTGTAKPVGREWKLESR